MFCVFEEVSSGLHIVLSLRTIAQTSVLTKTFQTDCMGDFAYTNLESNWSGKVHLDGVKLNGAAA